MANRREFLQKAMIASGAAAFTGNSVAFAQYLLAAESSLLPEGWKFYEVSGQILFPIYGDSGIFSTNVACYLIQKRGKEWHGFGITFSAEEMEMVTDFEKLKLACGEKLLKAIKEIAAIKIDMNGGRLPKLNA